MIWLMYNSRIIYKIYNYDKDTYENIEFPILYKTIEWLLIIIIAFIPYISIILWIPYLLYYIVGIANNYIILKPTVIPKWVYKLIKEDDNERNN